MLKPAGEADLPNLVYAAKSELSFVVRLSFFMCCLPRVVLIVSLFMNPMPKKFHVDSGRIPEYDMKILEDNNHSNLMRRKIQTYEGESENDVQMRLALAHGLYGCRYPL